MNFKKTLLTVLVAMGCSAAMAQQTTTETVFNPHWYVRGQIGGQYTLGEVKFGDLVSPNAQIAAGYNFTSLWGARIAVNAWQSKGGWGESTANSFGLPTNTYKWNYVAPAVDVKFNIINAIFGWNKDRVFTMNLIAGAGVNFAQSLDDAEAIYKIDPTLLEHYRDGSAMMPFGRFGLDFDFAVSKRVSLNLEAMAHVLNDHYNGKYTDNADWYFNALAGVKIALGKTVNKHVTVIEPEPVVVPQPEPEPAPVETGPRIPSREIDLNSIDEDDD